MSNYWARAMAEFHNRYWEEVLTPEERLGGPSPWGSSRWGIFKRCPYLYYWRYIRGMEPAEPDEALEIGGLYHEVRARYYNAYLNGLSDEDAIHEGHSLLLRTEKVTPAITAVVRRLYSGWLVHSGPGTVNDDRHLLPDEGGVEQKIEYYDGPFPYSTRIDFWRYDSEDRDGVLLKEIKTARKRTGQLLASYRMDSQFLGQMYLWREVMEPAGYPPLRRYMIDLAVKTNPASFSQEIAPVDNRMLSNWKHEMTQHYRELQFYEHSAKPWPRRRTYETCHYCKLFDHCASNGVDSTGWRQKNVG